MTCEKEVIDKIHNWIAKLTISHEKLNNFSVCPFAHSAKYKIICCKLYEINDFMPFNGPEVVIFVVEDTHSIQELVNFCQKMGEIHEKYIFLDDHKDDPTYINDIQTNFGEYNLIIAQKKEKLTTAREKLHKTDYYKLWSDEMYQKIVK